MTSSLLQDYTNQLLSIHFGKYTIRECYRPDWLLGPRGQRLELDFYIDELNVAIEVQGRQHYEFVPKFHKTYTAFQHQEEIDRTKRNICASLGIRLLEVENKQAALDAISAIKDLATPNKEQQPFFIPGNSVWMQLRSLRRILNREDNERRRKRLRVLALFLRDKLASWDGNTISRMEPNLVRSLVVALRDSETLLNSPLPVHEKKPSHKTPNQRKNQGQKRKQKEARKRLIEEVKPGHFRVWGGEREHLLTVQGQTIQCDCRAHPEIGGICCHILRYEMYVQEKAG